MHPRSPSPPGMPRCIRRSPATPRLPLDAELSTAVTGATAPRAPRPRLRRRDRPVDRADPARARQPLLPRPGAAAPGLHRRHAAHPHRGGRAQAEPGREDGTATGLVALRIRTENQRGEPVLDFLALPDDPAARPRGRDRATPTASRAIPRSSTRPRSSAAVPGDWGSTRAAARAAGAHLAELGSRDHVRGRGPRDGDRGAGARPPHAQRRDGPHRRRPAARTGAGSSTAAHDLGRRRARDARAPNLARSSPGSAATTSAGVRGRRPGDRAQRRRCEPLDDGGGLVDLRALVSAERAGSGEPDPVLDWSFVALMA